VTAKCNHCGRFLPEIHTGPCPNCGKTGKTITFTVRDGIQIADTVRYTTITEYYEKNTLMLGIVISITVFSAFLGLLLSGILGVFAGLLLGAVSFFLGPKAEIKIREITHGS